MLPRIFFAGGLAAAEMPLGKILLEHLFDAQIQFKIDALKPLRDVLMHGGFAGAEGDGAGADRTTRLYNIFSAFDRPALNFFPHKNRPLSTRYSIPMSKIGDLCAFYRLTPKHVSQMYLILSDPLFTKLQIHTLLTFALS